VLRSVGEAAGFFGAVEAQAHIRFFSKQDNRYILQTKETIKAWMLPHGARIPSRKELISDLDAQGLQGNLDAKFDRALQLALILI
jgi:hypothetical protein